MMLLTYNSYAAFKDAVDTHLTNPVVAYSGATGPGDRIQFFAEGDGKICVYSSSELEELPEGFDTDFPGAVHAVGVSV